MSTVPDIAPMIAAWPPASLLRLAGETATSKSALIDVLAKYQEDLEQETRALQSEVNAIWATVRELRDKVRPEEWQGVDAEATMLKFEDSERRIARDRSIGKSIARRRRRLARHGREILERFDRCMQKYAEFRLLVLRTMRDVRWELMALDAMRRGELSGPAFDDPKKLRRYLSKISR